MTKPTVEEIYQSKRSAIFNLLMPSQSVKLRTIELIVERELDCLPDSSYKKLLNILVLAESANMIVGGNLDDIETKHIASILDSDEKNKTSYLLVCALSLMELEPKVRSSCTTQTFHKMLELISQITNPYLYMKYLTIFLKQSSN